MKTTITGNTLTVIREDNDKKYYGTAGGAGESNFLYALKNELNEKGFDLIKKRMWKDGHLVDDMQQYLRIKNKNSNSPHIYLNSNFWALRGLNDDFNEGEVKINITFDVFYKQENCEKMMNDLLTLKQN